MQQRLAKMLGRWDSVAIIISITIGVGIFRVPSEVAQHLTDPGPIILAWVGGGLISLCGALCYAEVSSSFPETGGDYIYLRESYGCLVAFLFAWAELTVIRTGSIAAVSFVCAEYIRSFLSVSMDSVKAIAVIIVLAVSFINMYGLKYGKRLQNAAMTAKIAVLCCLAVFTAWSQLGSLSNFHSTTTGLDLGVLEAFGLALIPILWTYGGWHENTFLAGETREALATLPFALITGCLTTIVVYVVMNLLYLYLLPVQEIALSPLIGSDIMGLLWGTSGRKLFEVFIVVISLGCVNAMVITGSRVTYAMARDNAVFGYLSDVKDRYRTPHRAIWLNAAWSSALIILGNFHELLFFTGILVWFFFGLVAVGLFILRRKFPDTHRPYSVPGYPYIPALFALVCFVLCLNTLVFSTVTSLAGFGLLITGIPVYLLSQYNMRKL